MSLYTSSFIILKGHFKGEIIMRNREQFENDYLVNDRKYLEYYCIDECEAYEIEKSLSYDNDTWLFEYPKNYGLEDSYDEDSMP